MRKKNAVRLKCKSMTKAHGVTFPAVTVQSNECWSTTAPQAITRYESNWLRYLPEPAGAVTGPVPGDTARSEGSMESWSAIMRLSKRARRDGSR